MTGELDFRKYAILYVDDEEKSLKYFQQAFEDTFRILIAENAADGYALLEKHRDEIAILLTDQRMPGEKGVQLLERSRALNPRILRMLATAYTDYEAAVDAVNNGQVYKYIHKPWDPEELESGMRRAMEYFLLQDERDGLLRERGGLIERIVARERVESLGVLAEGLNHHIANALVSIRAFVELAPDKHREELGEGAEPKDPAFWGDYHDNVMQQVERISGLLSLLMHASEGAAGAREEELDIRGLAGEAADLLAERLEQKRVALRFDFSGDLPPVRGDRSRFRQFFRMLLLDEVENTPGGESILVRARGDDAGEASPDAVRLEVSNTGPPVVDESLDLLFSPFYVRSGDPAQLGVNLMACYLIAHNQGGRMEAENREDEGTVIVVTLPCAPARRAGDPSGQSLGGRIRDNTARLEQLLAEM